MVTLVTLALQWRRPWLCSGGWGHPGSAVADQSTYLLLVCNHRMPHPLLREILVYECSCVTARMTLSLPNSLAHRGVYGIVAVSFGLIVSRLIRGLRILVK